MIVFKIQGDPKKTGPNSNYSKYTGPVFFGSLCTYILHVDSFFMPFLQRFFGFVSSPHACKIVQVGSTHFFYMYRNLAQCSILAECFIKQITSLTA